MEIYEFTKNNVEKVIIRFNEFMRKELIDLRVYYKSNEGKDIWKPSHKGITKSRHLIPKLKDGIDKAFKEREKAQDKKN